MNEQEKFEFKQKALELMLTHLESKGFPEMSTQAIVNEFKAMYLKLEEAGLTGGIAFHDFAQIGVFEAQGAELRDQAQAFAQQFAASQRI